ncbi:hypothetical protein FJ651_03430 [Paucihalobacter ruber]|uniref:Uncharacterized protein n=1 Tax=Paucihalobacter ruber TaxID=2567861 RepID=A0A506PQ43_9FLAO|nr:right-handed parallel beta-helix repeat-containing protein [Paucihalobacter ruber]TPV35983.1 hypothetical protein FJ651_03430 [Paucihalobacter ruber]
MEQFSKMQLMVIIVVLMLFFCYTEGFDDNVKTSVVSSIDNISDCANINGQSGCKVIPNDFDWTNIPDNYADSIWEIKFDFDLGDASITLPDNVTLKFSGGLLKNYTSISGANTRIDAGLVGSFDGSGSLSGTWNLESVYPEWFGALGDGTAYDAHAFIKAVGFLKSMNGGNLILTSEKDYIIDKEILLTSNISILGNGATISVNPANWQAVNSGFYAIFATLHVSDKPFAAPGFELGNGIIKFRNIVIDNVTFNLNRDATDAFFQANKLHFSFNAVRLTDAQDSGIQNCTFIDGQNSTHYSIMPVCAIEKSINCFYKNNNSINSTPINVSYGTNCIVDNNVFDTTVSTAIEIYLGEHHKVTNNTIGTQWFDASTIGCSANYAYIGDNRIKASNAFGITMGHPFDEINYPGLPFDSSYSVVENNHITGGPVKFNADGTPTGNSILTGRIGIAVPNGKHVKILNNLIEDLYRDTAYRNDNAAIVIGGSTTDQTLFDNLIIDGNTIKGATVGIQVRDHINVTISDNHIENVFRGIYGEATVESSPTGKMIVDGNTIKNSGEALFLNCPENIVTNNKIIETDVFGYLYYGHYVFNNNIIKEAKVGPHSHHPLSFTMKHNYFYNTVPLGDISTGSIMTMRAPQMALENLIIEGNTIDYPVNGTPTTWVVRAYELQGYVGSQYFNSTMQ